MSLNSLGDLFGDLGGLKDDLATYGTMAGGAVGAKIIWDAMLKYGVKDGGSGTGVTAVAPAVRTQLDFMKDYVDYVMPVVQIAVGVFGGNQIAKYNKNVGVGVAVGLIADAVVKLIVAAMPDQAKQVGLAALPNGEVMITRGLSAAPMRVLPPRLNAAPTTVEQLRAAPPVVPDLTAMSMARRGMAGLASTLY